MMILSSCIHLSLIDCIISIIGSSSLVILLLFNYWSSLLTSRVAWWILWVWLHLWSACCCRNPSAEAIFVVIIIVFFILLWKFEWVRLCEGYAFLLYDCYWVVHWLNLRMNCSIQISYAVFVKFETDGH